MSSNMDSDTEMEPRIDKGKAPATAARAPVPEPAAPAAPALKATPAAVTSAALKDFLFRAPERERGPAPSPTPA